MTSPRPQISQREPVKPKPTPVAPVTTPVSTAVKEPVSTTKIHLKILLVCMNVNVNWLLIVRIQMKRLPLMYAIPQIEEATEIDLLLSNESILIDFQYMTEVQAMSLFRLFGWGSLCFSRKSSSCCKYYVLVDSN